jgi:hypothetical protein
MSHAARILGIALVCCAAALGCTAPDGGDEDGGSASTDAGSGDAGDDPYCPVVDYAACGGDLLGTWALRALCPEDPAAAAALCEHPYDDRAVCSGAGHEAICDSSAAGTFTFNGDDTVDIDTTLTLISTWHFTDDCLADVDPAGADAEARCLGMGNDRLTCSYQDHCSCVSDPMPQSDTTTGTWAIVDGDLVLGDDPPSSYCVDGDGLVMDYYVYHPVSWRYWVLERE